jgi:hypothetical protein
MTIIDPSLGSMYFARNRWFLADVLTRQQSIFRCYKSALLDNAGNPPYLIAVSCLRLGGAVRAGFGDSNPILGGVYWRS